MIRTLMTAALGLFLVTTAPVLASEGTPDEAKAMVEKAVATVQADGRDAAYTAFHDQNGAFVDRDLYVFVFDTTGTIHAHGANQKLVGKSLWKVKDVDGVAMIQEMVKVAQEQGSGWVDYRWPHPVTKKLTPKTSYVTMVDDVIVGVGAHK